MSEREAQVKLTLDNAQFLVTIKQTGDAVDANSKRGKKSMDLFGAGIDRAKKSMQDLGGKVKDTLAMAAGFGGAFSLAAGVHSAIKLRSEYSRLSFGINQAKGAMMSANDVQKLVERTAADTGRTNEEMVKTFADIKQATGDLEFSRKVLAAIGTTATATGIELDTITTITDQLHTKFGVTADRMQDTLAQVFELSQQGGPAFNEFADVISNVGAELLAAGLDGKRGLDFMLGALVQTDDRLKSLPAQVKGLKAVLRGLGDEGELKKLAQKIGIDPKKLINEKDALGRLRAIFAQGKRGMDALMGSMKEGEEQETMKILFLDPFKEAMDEASKAGLKGKAQIDSALSTFDKQIGELGKASTNAATLQKRAAEAREEPEARLREALNRLNTAMGQPQIIKAIDDLSVHLPKLAEIFGDLVSFAASNPILAATLGIGGKAGASFVAGMAQQIIAAHLKGGQLAGAAAGAGGGAAGAAGKMGALGTVGAAGMVAGGAATAFAVGREAIDNAFGTEKGKSDELSSATMAGFSGGGSIEEMRAKIARIQKASKNAGDVGTGFFDTVGQLFHDGPSRADQNMKDQELAGQAIARLESKIRQAEQKAAIAAEIAAATPAPGATPVAQKPKPVQLDPSGPKMIGDAVSTALGGKVLTVRIANAGELGLGRAAAGPGGSRGPMAAPATTPGGGF